MRPLNLDEVTHYVEANIGNFHAARLNSLKNLKLDKILKRKNPYLFRAKNILVAGELVRTLLDAHLSSQEETHFGDFLEGLAIFVCGRVFGGTKSTTEGIDLEFTRDEVRYVVAIKSGPNWGNSSQIKKMLDQFATAKRVFRTSGHRSQVIEAVNGCCYGQDNAEKDAYRKLCGQSFWEFISGDNELYTRIVHPLGHRAKERNEDFQQNYAAAVNSFTLEFSKRFCIAGSIDWDALVRFNSAA